MSLKELPVEERPRERLTRLGAQALSSVELLAILLGHGTQKRSVLELAADLLKQFGSLKKLAEASLIDLRKVNGIGEAKAIQLKAAFSLFQRLEEGPSRTPLYSPEAVYSLIQSELMSQSVEVLMVVLRNVRRECIHREMIAKGTLTELLMHPREIFHVAIQHRAHSLIVAHNHPSGHPEPSQSDLQITKLLEAAGKLVGIELADHLIVGSGRFVSLWRTGGLARDMKIFSY